MNLKHFLAALGASVCLIAQASAEVRIMPLGDSITAGLCDGTSACVTPSIVGKKPPVDSMHPADPLDPHPTDLCYDWANQKVNAKATGYRPYLKELLSNAGLSSRFVGGMEYINVDQPNQPNFDDRMHEGHGGWTTSQIQTCVSQWITDASPDIVLLHIGTNDAIGPVFNSVDQMIGNLKGLITSIYAAKPTVRIIVAQIIPTSHNCVFAILNSCAELRIIAYNNYIKNSLASDFPGITTISMNAESSSSSNPMEQLSVSDLTDGIHPTSTGYEKMARAWSRAILPTVYSPAPNSTLSGSAVTFYWATGSGVSQYYLYVGSSFAGGDLYAASQGLATSGTVSGLPTDGRPLYVRLWFLINNGWQFRDYTYTAANVGTPGYIYSPATGSTLPGAAVTFYWTGGSGVSQYYLYVGSSSGANSLYSASQGLSTAATVTGLPTNGQTLYVRLWSLIGSAWQFRDYTYTAATVACSPLTGTHGQVWRYETASAQYGYHSAWCGGGTLPPQCSSGTYYYQYLLGANYCTSLGSGGSCNDSDAWWFVTCNALIDCIYNCSGQCVKADC